MSTSPNRKRPNYTNGHQTDKRPLDRWTAGAAAMPTSLNRKRPNYTNGHQTDKRFLDRWTAGAAAAEDRIDRTRSARMRHDRFTSEHLHLSPNEPNQRPTSSRSCMSRTANKLSQSHTNLLPVRFTTHLAPKYLCTVVASIVYHYLVERQRARSPQSGASEFDLLRLCYCFRAVLQTYKRMSIIYFVLYCVICKADPRQLQKSLHATSDR